MLRINTNLWVGMANFLRGSQEYSQGETQVGSLDGGSCRGLSQKCNLEKMPLIMIAHRGRALIFGQFSLLLFVFLSVASVKYTITMLTISQVFTKSEDRGNFLP